MAPLRREWTEALEKIASLAPDVIETRHGESLFRPADESRIQEAQRLVDAFLDRLRAIRVLDPALRIGELPLRHPANAEGPGKGNPRRVSAPRVEGIRAEGWTASTLRDRDQPLCLRPGSDDGLDRIHPVAEGQRFPIEHEPILQSLHNFELKDAILDLTDPENPVAPDWPDSDFIVGNPPFLGGKKLRTELGDAYVDKMFSLWREHIRPEADLCCYWFEKARRQIELGKCRRVGLLATQGIRGGANRHTLDRIKSTGDVFFAISDRDWIIDGATVHISLVGFDNGTERMKSLNGVRVDTINSNLSSEADITQARRLIENAGLAFMGDTKGGSFDIPERLALALLDAPNPHGRPNSDVVVPWINGLDVTRRNRNIWIIDFGTNASIGNASLYEKPFAFVREHVHSERQRNKRQVYKERWWIHVEARPSMRDKLEKLPRFIATARVSKHRLFAWVESPTLPDCQLIVFARSDDFPFGVLHSRLHEVWARAHGTQVRERESGFRYTPTTCFETFPLPEPN